MNVSTSICRICLKAESITFNLFDYQDTMQYSTKLRKCVGITIIEHDSLPKSICGDCVTDLNLAYDFVLKCEEADRLLHTTVANDLLASDSGETVKQEFNHEPHIKLEIDNAYDNNHYISDDDNIYLSDIKYDREEHAFNKPRKSRSGRKSSKKSLKKKHRAKILKGIRIECHVCNLSVAGQSAMDIHMRTHTGEKPFECEFCGGRFSSKGLMKGHIDIHHSERERRFTCETCGSRYYRKHDIIIHMRKHTGETPYACPFCPRSFQQPGSLARHKRTHTGDKPYPCHICGKCFADSSTVRKHQLVHSDVRRHPCHLCGKSFKIKTALDSHMNTHTNEKLHLCSICGAAFSLKGNLKKHINKVHSERASNCHICNKEFSNLLVHMRKHTGELLYPCQMCQRSFSTQSSLKNHVQFKHGANAKYKCQENDCEKAFPTLTMLEFHLLKHHKNQTPFKCEHCGRGFFRLSDLTKHLKLSHKPTTVMDASNSL